MTKNHESIYAIYIRRQDVSYMGTNWAPSYDYEIYGVKENSVDMDFALDSSSYQQFIEVDYMGNRNHETRTTSFNPLEGKMWVKADDIETIKLIKEPIFEENDNE